MHSTKHSSLCGLHKPICIPWLRREPKPNLRIAHWLPTEVTAIVTDVYAIRAAAAWRRTRLERHEDYPFAQAARVTPHAAAHGSHVDDLKLRDTLRIRRAASEMS